MGTLTNTRTHEHAQHNWYYLPDACLLAILNASLEASDIAALRFVCRGWRRHIDAVLYKLSPRMGCDLNFITGTFSALIHLEVVVGPVCRAYDSSFLAPLCRLVGLQHLTMKGCFPTCATALTLEECMDIAAIPNLRSLTLRSVGLVLDDGWNEAIKRACSRKQPIKSLQLSDVLLCIQAPVELQYIFDTVETLEFDGKIAYGIEATESIRIETTRLTSLKLKGVLPYWQPQIYTMIASSSSLSSLYIDAHSLLVPVSSSGESLALALVPSIDTLRSLTLHGCVINDSLLHSIAKCTLLTSLTLTPNSLDPVEAEGCLDVVDCTALLFKPLRNLQHLCLGGWPVGSMTCRVIQQSLPSLETLELSGCTAVNDTVLYKIATLPLRELRVRHCLNVSDIGVAALCKGRIRECLRVLDISGCARNVTDTALEVIGGSMMPLKELRFSGCERLTDEGLLKLVLPKKRSLEVLVCSDCPCITDSGVLAIAVNVPNLESIDVEHCPKVTNQSLNGLIQILSHLEVVRAFGSGIQGTKDTRRGRIRIEVTKPCWWLNHGHFKTVGSLSRRHIEEV